jgi:hypothetical protein
MVTLRSYPDLIEASNAKSFLETNGIAATLADENVNSWAAAKFAISVRLLVPEDQVEAANRLLNDADAGRAPRA